jgi:hypothetical protein
VDDACGWERGGVALGSDVGGCAGCVLAFVPKRVVCARA